jgi:hypothetical protein
MAKTRISRDRAEDERMMAAHTAEVMEENANLIASQAPTSAPSSFEPVAEPAPIDAAAYRQDMACDVFRALVHGLRIQVKDGESPGATAHRVLELHSKLMSYATKAGIIPADPAAE